MDSLVIIPNERLKYATDQKITFANAFEIADDVLRQAVQSISDLIRDTGFINLDFADVTAIMKNAGMAHMGVGRAAGKGKAEEAAQHGHLQPPAGDLHRGRQGRAHQRHRLHGHRPGGGGAGCQPGSGRPYIPTRSPSSAPPLTRRMDDEIRVTVIATGFEKTEETPVTPGLKTPVSTVPAGTVPPAAAPAEEKTPHAEPPQPLEMEEPKPEENDPFEDIFKIFQNRD